MSKVANVVRSIKVEPFIAVEMIWGLALIIDGVYLMLPVYQPTTGSVFLALAASSYVLLGIAVLYIISGTLAVWASFKDRFRNVSVFVLFLTFLFTALIRLLTVGPVPATWVWPALLAVAAGVDYWQLKWNRYSTL